MTSPADTPRHDSASRRIALLVEYDGTEFAGSQAQADQRTVQDVLEAAIVEFTAERQRVTFAGRTDAGVHARGQVVALNTSTAHSPSTFRDALNHFLPDDVAVRAAAEVAADFNPRRDACARAYRYEIDDGADRSPLRRHHAWQVRDQLDARAMADAAVTLPTDDRDWAAFAGSVPDDYPTIRTMRRVEVRRCTPRRMAVTMEASGFLPHQVRRTVGALERVGAGKISVDDFAKLIDGPPGTAGPTAPPQGLTLAAVRYEPEAVAWDCAYESRSETE